MNTSIFCDQPAKNAVIYSVFLLGFQKHWYLQCFVHLGSKKYWYLHHFLHFCMAPAKDVKTQKCCNLQHFVTFEKWKIVRKKSKRRFFPILGTIKIRGGGLCSWRRLWATRIPSKKLSTTLLKDVWCFSGPGQNPAPPVWRVPKIGKKRRFYTFFGRFFAFRNWQNAINYSIFAF